MSSGRPAPTATEEPITVDAQVARLVDRAEIVELHNLYAELLDTGRVVEVAPSVCTEDVVWDHGSGVETARGRAAVTAFLVSMTDRYEGTLHALTNVSVRLDGDGATSRTYLQAYHWLRASMSDGEGRPADVVTTGVYIDDLVRTPDGWRIATRKRRSVGPSPVGIGQLPDFMRGIGG